MDEQDERIDGAPSASRSHSSAWADPGGILPVIDCKILDLTEDGARVVAPPGVEMPQVFQLQIDSLAHSWRGGSDVARRATRSACGSSRGSEPARSRKLGRATKRALARAGHEAAMSNTTTTYLSIANNLARYQKLTPQQPAVKTATAYYQAHIGQVKSVGQFVGNYRLLSYALQAYGLGDQINNTALIKQVLSQGTASPKALANTLPNANWKAFAKAFNFSATGAASPTSAASVATTQSDYVEQQLEDQPGRERSRRRAGALFQARRAERHRPPTACSPTRTCWRSCRRYSTWRRPPAPAQIDKQAHAIQKLVPLADLQDPKKLNRLVERFTAAYDAKYGPASGATTPLSVNNGNAPSTRFGGVLGARRHRLRHFAGARAGIRASRRSSVRPCSADLRLGG